MLLKDVNGVLEVLVDVVVRGGLEDGQGIKRYTCDHTKCSESNDRSLTILYAAVLPSLEAMSVQSGGPGYASTG